MGELGCVVVAREARASCREQKGRGSFAQSWRESWATAEADGLGLVLLTVLLLFTTEQLTENSTAEEGSSSVQKNCTTLRMDHNLM